MKSKDGKEKVLFIGGNGEVFCPSDESILAVSDDMVPFDNFKKYVSIVPAKRGKEYICIPLLENGEHVVIPPIIQKGTLEMLHDGAVVVYSSSRTITIYSYEQIKNMKLGEHLFQVRL